MLPPWQMRALYATHPAPPWEFVAFPHAGHMDAYDSAAAQYWPALRQFVEAVVPSDPAHEQQQAQQAQEQQQMKKKQAAAAGKGEGGGAAAGAAGGKPSWVLVGPGGGEEGEACDDPTCTHQPHA